MRIQKPPPPPSQPSTSWLSIAMAGLLALLAGVTLFYLTLGFFAVVVMIGGLLSLFVGAHYLVWGRWLGPMIRAEVEAEEAEARSDGPFGHNGDEAV